MFLLFLVSYINTCDDMLLNFIICFFDITNLNDSYELNMAGLNNSSNSNGEGSNGGEPEFNEEDPNNDNNDNPEGYPVTLENEGYKSEDSSVGNENEDLCGCNHGNGDNPQASTCIHANSHYINDGDSFNCCYCGKQEPSPNMACGENYCGCVFHSTCPSINNSPEPSDNNTANLNNDSSINNSSEPSDNNNTTNLDNDSSSNKKKLI